MSVNTLAWGEAVAEFLAEHPKGGTRSLRMNTLIDEFVLDRHFDAPPQTILRRAITLARNGEGDVHWALREILDAYLLAGDTSERREAFELSVREQVVLLETEAAMTDGAPDESDPLEYLDAEIELALEKLKVRAEAQRRYNASIMPTVGELLDWDELEARSSRPHLVSGLLEAGGTSLLVSKRNIGKSMFAVALACSMASGVDFLDRPVQRGKVLFVLGEGENGIPDRVHAWCDANGADEAEIREQVRLFGRGPNLSNDETLTRLREAVESFKPDLVILDTWTSVSGVVNEIDQSEAQRALYGAKQVVGDAALMILHHPNSESEDGQAPRSRGGSALPSGVDTVMTLWLDGNHSEPSLPGRKFMALSTEDAHAGKQKDMARETIRGLYLEEGEGAPYLAFANRVLSVAERWVNSHMPYREPVAVGDLEKPSKTPRATIQRHISASPAYVVRLSEKRGKSNLYMRVK